MFKVVLLMFIWIAPFTIEAAAKIQFPTSELAQESVLPVFEDPQAVKNRTVVTDGKLEPNLFVSWTLNDAFVEPLSFGGMLTYHINETHGIQFYGIKFSEEKNDYPQQIFEETGADIRNTVAIPKSAYLAAYQITPFYGKISFTKQGVTNLSIYGNLGLGQIQIDEDNDLAYSFGIGTKFYFGSRLNARIDYRFLYYDARNPIRTDFSSSYQLNSILAIGVGYLLF